LQPRPIPRGDTQQFAEALPRQRFQVFVPSQHPSQELRPCPSLVGGAVEQVGSVIRIHGNSPFRRRNRAIRSLWRFTSACGRSGGGWVRANGRGKAAVSLPPCSRKAQISLSLGSFKASSIAACFSPSCRSSSCRIFPATGSSATSASRFSLPTFR